MFTSLKPGRLLLLAAAIALLAALPSGAQDRAKPSDEEVQKVRENVKKLNADVEKLYSQLDDAWRKLQQAQAKLAEVEGRPPFPRPPSDRRGGFGGPGGFGPGGGGFGRGPFGPSNPTPPASSSGGDLEKRLDRLMKELEDLRKEIRKTPSK